MNREMVYHGFSRAPSTTPAFQVFEMLRIYARLQEHYDLTDCRGCDYCAGRYQELVRRAGRLQATLRARGEVLA